MTALRALAALIVVPSYWLLIEWIRSWQGFGGPWALLGASQWQHPVVLALASVGGVWLVSFAVVAANTGLTILVAAGVVWGESSIAYDLYHAPRLLTRLKALSAADGAQILVNQDTLQGAHLIVYQTSDSTVQQSWAPAQHASLGAVRAAETGRPGGSSADRRLGPVIKPHAVSGLRARAGHERDDQDRDDTFVCVGEELFSCARNLARTLPAARQAPRQTHGSPGLRQAQHVQQRAGLPGPPRQR